MKDGYNFQDDGTMMYNMYAVFWSLAPRMFDREDTPGKMKRLPHNESVPPTSPNKAGTIFLPPGGGSSWKYFVLDLREGLGLLFC